jgi:hypothetical protein
MRFGHPFVPAMNVVKDFSPSSRERSQGLQSVLRMNVVKDFSPSSRERSQGLQSVSSPFSVRTD